jgi:hypothetical protein
MQGEENMNRREFICLSATGAPALPSALALDGRGFGTPLASGFAAVEVDHLMFGAADLDGSIAYIERMTGVRPVFGGQHPNRGTHNALLSLGPRQYLEIIAPDPAQANLAVTESRPALLKRLTGPRLLTWSAGTRNIEAVEKGLVSAGFKSGGIAPGSRKRPDGKMLQWRTLSVLDQGDDVVPFFIEWGKDSPHPAGDSAKGCELLELRLEHPNWENVNRVLQAMGLQSRAAQGPEPRLRARIRSPKGEVELT